MQVIAIPHWLKSALADLVGVVAVLTAEPFSNALLEAEPSPEIYATYPDPRSVSRNQL